MRRRLICAAPKLPRAALGRRNFHHDLVAIAQRAIEILRLPAGGRSSIPADGRADGIERRHATFRALADEDEMQSEARTKGPCQPPAHVEELFGETFAESWSRPRREAVAKFVAQQETVAERRGVRIRYMWQARRQRACASPSSLFAAVRAQKDVAESRRSSS